MNNPSSLQNIIYNYKKIIRTHLTPILTKIIKFCKLVENCWRKNKTIFIIGNGGSGANAQHIANDFLYGAGISNNKGLKSKLWFQIVL